MNDDRDSDRTVRLADPRSLDVSAIGRRDGVNNVLPIGTRLAEFEIVDVIGVGGFGIVYQAIDHSLGRKVALKEYMPQELAIRRNGLTVQVRPDADAEAFEAGRKSFVYDEARLLAKFDHPSLVKVYRFWEENGTAYMVMPDYGRRTLKSALKAMPTPPDERWLRRLLDQLLDALETIHSANVFHRDIAPDNILLLDDDRPLLLDFGAARHVITDMTQVLTVIFKPGYAPIEQYPGQPHLKQGAWTDLYALAAVMRLAITGKPPERQQEPLAKLAAGRYSQRFLAAIDAALAIQPQDRPQSVAAFRALIGPAPEAAVLPEKEQRSLPGSPPAGPGLRGDLRPSGFRTAAARPSPIAVSLIAAGVVAVVLATAYVWQARLPVPAPVPPLHNGQANVTPVPPTPPPSGPEPATPAPAPPAAFNAVQELDRIYDARAASHQVSVVVPQSVLVIDQDPLSFSVKSSQDGYLYILMVGTDQEHFYLLFPNQIDPDNRIASNTAISLPRAGWRMVASGPPGVNRFLVVVTDAERDFRSSGFRPVDAFREFDPSQTVVGAPGTPAPDSILGTPLCASPPCSGAYGAARFSTREITSVAHTGAVR